MFGRTKKSPRLENWDGRTQSSRQELSFLSGMWHRETFVRWLPVAITSILLVLILHAIGPSCSYRSGASARYDFRARVSFATPNAAYTSQRELYPDASEPNQGIEAWMDAPPLDRYPAGTILIKRGQPITPAKLALLQAEHSAFVEQLSWVEHLIRLLSLLLILVLLAGMITLYVARFQKAIAQSLRPIVGLCVVSLLTLAAAFWLGRQPWDAETLPLTLTAMILSFAYSPPFALLLSFCLAIVYSLGQSLPLSDLLVHLGGLGTAILLIHGIRSRGRPVEVGAIVGLAYLCLHVATGMLHDQPGRMIITDGLRDFCWSMVAGCVMSGLLPQIERCFGVMSDATLLELADHTHPLIQELLKRAPGTYTHSILVASLGEAAAESIGANPLLVRVGCYFHDIGKMIKPDYFIENQTGENRHDQLEPALSTLVIIGHVKDGLALGRQYGLPRPIIDFIQQHHGTTLVEYFYREAKRIQLEAGNGNTELEYRFRYPGPKPQTREAGILMLADAAESASRALSVPNPSSLRKLVHEMMMRRLLDGQFDDSGLTLTELQKIVVSLTNSLIAVYHARIRYAAAEDTKQVG